MDWLKAWGICFFPKSVKQSDTNHDSLEKKFVLPYYRGAVKQEICL